MVELRVVRKGIAVSKYTNWIVIPTGHQHTDEWVASALESYEAAKTVNAADDSINPPIDEISFDTEHANKSE